MTATESAAAPPIDPIRGRLEELKSLDDGWADGMQPAAQWGEGYGKAPAAQGLDWLASQFAAHYDSALPRPYLYPTPEGGVSVEWSLGPYRASLEVDLETCQGEWHCLDLSTSDSYERDLEIAEPEAWVWIAEELRRLDDRTA